MNIGPLDGPKIAFVIALPALLTGVATYATARRWSAVAVVFAVAISVAVGMPQIAKSIPIDLHLGAPVGPGWIFWAAIALIPIAVLEVATGLNRWPIWLMGLVAIGAFLYLDGKARTVGTRGWDFQTAATNISLAIGFIGFAFISTRVVSLKVGIAGPALVLAATSFIASVLIATSGGSEIIGYPIAIVGIGAAMLGVGSLIFPSMQVGASVWLAICLISGGLTISSTWWASLLNVDVFLLLAAPSTCWAAVLARKDNRFAAAAVALIAGLAALAIPLLHMIEELQSLHEQGYV